MKKILSISASLIVIAGALFIQACTSSGGTTVIFTEPNSISSSGGILQTTLTTAITTNTVQNPATAAFDTVNTPTYNGGLIGPTLRLKPGDSLRINLVNNFPENPGNARTGAFPHKQYTTNFHTHGLTVSPSGISDNIFRLMEPGTISEIQIDIPSDHECGTFWYHPHKHGSVSYQFFGGMSGFLIIEGCTSGLEQVSEVAAAREVLMGFQVIRTDADGNVPFVNLTADQFSSDNNESNGLWSTYQNSNFYITTNGVTNPVLNMRPGEVQRWRLLNAASGITLAVALQQHQFNIIANDGVTVSTMQTFETGQAYVMGAGNRVDFLVKAGEPGTYLLQALDPTTTDRSVSPSGVSPGPRNARVGSDFPNVTYPVTLATVVISGDPISMSLPSASLPYPGRLPSVETMLNTMPDATRNVAFELCGQGGQQQQPENRLPSCGWYFDLYDADYWGGTEFKNLLMARDADDTGEPSDPLDPNMPRINYQKDGLFNAEQALFDDMVVGNYEEWTVINRSNSDHPFHIHTNPFLLTHINGEELPAPEWRDTLLIPAATGGGGNINDATFGTVTFRTWYDPRFTGSMVFHCHILTHEDVGMMQRLDLVEE